jgi:hypothetical protein
MPERSDAYNGFWELQELASCIRVQVEERELQLIFS